MSFWRKKVEIEEDLKRLIELQDSEVYNLWTGKIRKAMCHCQMQLLQTDIREEKSILALVGQWKQLYSVLKMVPSEQYNSEDELDLVEKLDRDEVKQLRNSEERKRQRTGGAM